MASPGATGEDPVDGRTAGRPNVGEAASAAPASGRGELTRRRRAEHRDEHPAERADRGEDGDACRQRMPPSAATPE